MLTRWVPHEVVRNVLHARDTWPRWIHLRESENTEEAERFAHELVSTWHHAWHTWRIARMQSVVPKLFLSAWNCIPVIRALGAEERFAHEVHLPRQYSIQITRRALKSNNTGSA